MERVGSVFRIPINTKRMKENLQTIPSDEVVLRLIACCNEIERERKNYISASDEISRWKKAYDEDIHSFLKK